MATPPNPNDPNDPYPFNPLVGPTLEDVVLEEAKLLHELRNAEESRDLGIEGSETLIEHYTARLAELQVMRLGLQTDLPPDPEGERRLQLMLAGQELELERRDSEGRAAANLRALQKDDEGPAAA